jgi:hypothetical protein
LELLKRNKQKKSLSGGDMKKLIAVAVVALGTFGLLMMRSPKTAVAAPPAPTRELSPF